MKNTVILGAKHAGKSTVGKALAKLCALDFIDLDELIAQQSGKSPRSLYKEGVDIFKNAEEKAVKSLNTEDSAVIAAGGGIIDNENAVTFLRNGNFLLVYLEISAETAWKRISGGGKTLPPFLDTSNPQETHRNLHERRSSAYKDIADITVNAENKSAEIIAEEIAKSIKR